MPQLKVQKTRLEPELIRKLDEMVEQDKKDHPYHAMSKSEVIRKATTEYIERLWKPPLFTDQPERPIKAPAETPATKPAVRARKPRVTNHRETPAARKYHTHMKRKKARTR